MLDFFCREWHCLALVLVALIAPVVLTGCEAESVTSEAVASELGGDKPEPADRPGGDDDGDDKESNSPADRKGRANKPTNEKPALGNDDPRVPMEENLVAQNAQTAAEEDQPFPTRVRMPELPKDMTWINTSGPLRLSDLKGKFVVLDFWTYCCINCIHILPELKKLEHAYPDEVVVIGVHSAKFETEKDTKNIEEAVLRYEIEHPVVNDADHRIWNMIGIQSWPSLLLIDPEGYAVMMRNGETEFETLDALLKDALPYYKKRGLLDDSPVHFDLLASRQKPTPLRFPGKVLADEPGNRLFITDSNHNRIVICSLDGKLLDVIGSGAIGSQDGTYDEASFDHPQGVALHGDLVYVADTENHMLRKIDLASKSVATIAGDGKQSRNPWPGLDGGPLAEVPERFVGKPNETGLNSPWALWVHDKDLYIAMAGPHQIWKMKLDESEIGPYAGNGREDIVDGPLLPKQPYEIGYSSFAQPSGLASDGQWLYVADTEGSSVRAVPFDPKKEARTVVGSSKLPGGRLFAFGDRDGKEPFVELARDNDGLLVRDAAGDIAYQGVQLQHAIGIAYHDGQLYIADTYNNKIKVINAKTGETKTLAGNGKAGSSDEDGTFDEPAGIAYAKGKLYIADTNNHAIRTLALKTNKVGTLRVEGLTPAQPPRTKEKPTFEDAVQVEVDPQQIKLVDGKAAFKVQLELPAGWKINDLAPMSYFVEAEGEGPLDRQQLPDELTPVAKPAPSFEFSLPATGSGKDQLRVSLNYFYCQADGAGLCKVGSVAWTIPVEVSEDAENAAIALKHTIKLKDTIKLSPALP